MKRCFIITPIGITGSDIRRETDGLIASVLSPVLAEFDLEPIPAHQISETGSITRQVIKRIIESELVIANLTNLNPNVMYEVGIRHCARKPMIVVAREGTILPFDLSDERTIFFQNDMSGAEELKEQLRKMIPKTLDEGITDNPVYRVVDVDLIKLPEGTADVSVLADRKFSLIEDQLEELKVGLRALMSYGRKNRVYVEKNINALSSGESGMDHIEFSVLVERQEHLERLTASCEAKNIKYDVNQVYKDVDKFTAFCTANNQLKYLSDVAKELNLKHAP